MSCVRCRGPGADGGEKPAQAPDPSLFSNSAQAAQAAPNGPRLPR
eukprot:SAG31_NODE_3700_length_3975_cov_36.979102_1_plen_44_part_10